MKAYVCLVKQLDKILSKPDCSLKNSSRWHMLSYLSNSSFLLLQSLQRALCTDLLLRAYNTAAHRST